MPDRFQCDGLYMGNDGVSAKDIAFSQAVTRTGKRNRWILIVSIVAVLQLGVIAWLISHLASVYGADVLSSPSTPTRVAVPALQIVAADKPKNVVLMIADGAGLNHFSATRIHYHGLDGRLAVDQMPITGLMITHSANRLVTDSAAAATAMVTGHKTNNGYLGLDPEGKPLTTFFA